MGRERYYKGEMTIMAALVLGLIISLFVVMIESAATSFARTRITTVANVSCESLFSHYSKPLAKKYEVFGSVIYEDEEIEKKLSEYMRLNCEAWGGFDPYQVTYKGVYLKEKKLLTDDDGNPFYDEIVRYMKLGVFDAGLLDTSMLDFVEELRNSEKTDNIKAVSDELEARNKEASKIDAKILKVLSLVEGVKTNSSGFSMTFGHLSSTGSFVKRVCVKGTGYGSTGVNNADVYNAVSGSYYDIISALESLKSELDLIVMVYLNPVTKGLFIDAGFRFKLMEINSVITSSRNKIAQARKYLDEINSQIATLNSNLEKSKQVLISNSEKLGDALTASYMDEFNELNRYANGDANKLFNLNDLAAKLDACDAKLSEIQSVLETMLYAPMDIDNIGNFYGMVDGAIAVSAGFMGDEIVFNYDGVTFGKGKEISFIEKIKKVYENGALALVINDVSKISNKSSGYTDLTCDKLGVKSTGGNSLSLDYNKLFYDLLYNKYIDLNFGNFLSPNEKGVISYETEYILGGSKKDKENLSAVVDKLIGLRFAMNMAYIMLDAKKKQECLAMATTLLGFTGVYGVIKLGQYLLLSTWAYAEAISDVRILYNKGKVALTKTESQWKTTLSEIVENKMSKDATSNKAGLNYAEYLQLLLFLENKKVKIYRTMDVMELNMIATGNADVRFYKLMYEAKFSALFTYYKGKYQYTKEIEYHY